MKIKILFLISLLTASSFLSINITPSKAKNNTDVLQQALLQFQNDSELQNAFWGFYAKSVKTGAVVAQYNARKSLTPASALKVITTAAALEVLGKDHTFQTILEYDGQIDAKGTLKGNLYIRGGGDPTLGSPREGLGESYTAILQLWASAIRKAGIKSIEGYVVGDARFFEEESVPPAWLWEDLGNYYGTGASGLAFHENQYFAYFNSESQTGGSTNLTKITPTMPNFQIVNRVKAGAKGSGDNAYIFSAPYSSNAYIRGTIPPARQGFRIKGSIANPALFCAYQLQQELTEIGIKAAKGYSTVRLLEYERKYVPRKRTVLKQCFLASAFHDCLLDQQKKHQPLCRTSAKSLGQTPIWQGHSRKWHSLGQRVFENLQCEYLWLFYGRWQWTLSHEWRDCPAIWRLVIRISK